MSSTKISYSREFNQFWKIYPKKLHKNDAYTQWKLIIKSKEVANDELIRAVKNYIVHCETHNIEKQYMLLGKNFLKNSSYEDYLGLNHVEEPKIKGGYINLARCYVESPIWKKPPLYGRVWEYLLTRAQHTNYHKLKRGQLFTSIPEILEACSWWVRRTKVTPSVKEIRVILDWLKDPTLVQEDGKRKLSWLKSQRPTSDPMITVKKVTHGVVITILNYDFYQDVKNYSHPEKQRPFKPQ